tara:strand:+ start:37 stop:459 length:423 start_codon:yes stop_codon:yes gene_type:complete
MADTKVSDLTPITIPSTNDILYIVRDSVGTSNKITFGNLLSGVTDNVTTLNTNVNVFKQEVQTLSTYFNTLNITDFISDIATLSTQVHVLTTETDDLYQTTDYATVAYTKMTVLTGGLTQSIPTAGGTLNFINGVLQSVT